MNGRNLYRFTFRVTPRRTRTCDQWHSSPAEAQVAAHAVAREWGEGTPLEILSVARVDPY